MYSLEGTNWSFIDEFILKYFQESTRVVKNLDINSIHDLDPAVAATLAYELTKHFMVFDSEMEQNPASEKAVRANSKTADQLLTDRNGVCRHFTKVAIAIYDRLKQINNSGSLTDTVLLPVGNTLMDDVSEPHAYCLLVAKRAETVLSIGDPTFFTTMDKEVHSDLRLASLVQTLVEKNLLSVLDIKEEILLFLIDGELNRLDKWIDFNKKFATKKATTRKASKSKASRSKSTRSTVKATPRKAVSLVTGRPTSFLADQQEAFHKAHPNANMLIGWLLVLFVILMGVYFYYNGNGVQIVMSSSW